jgi:F0F1-type ATP synthase assembly protein I
MSDPGATNKQRNQEIADNESARQTASAVRVSSFAIAVTVLIALAAFGWIFFGR